MSDNRINTESDMKGSNSSSLKRGIEYDLHSLSFINEDLNRRSSLGLMILKWKECLRTSFLKELIPAILHNLYFHGRLTGVRILSRN